ncbi:acyl carrier protein [Nitrosomonas oligotropha]|uniref:Acyl carrier protein n=1 Tax=Nitrosomonas oligotropha TaxID=42354 RepID=A0A1H8MFH4_9PROT|nr:phosphopantetheine-binding protein [Nitrosomonas oligotropha]SDW46896.1 acyl carrier protein [Nitrosomonas oligotropha]SEO16014.1 acyl carrier protein [Nitrosomonas oligotropha]
MTNTSHTTEIKKILADILGLGNRIDAIEPDTILLGNIPELDSVAVVTIILALEKNFSIAITDDEISAKTFATLGTLVDFVEQKITDRDKQFV